MNPLTEEMQTPFGTPDFPNIANEHYLPALTEAVGRSLAALEDIANDEALPTFTNTIEALEFVGLDVNRIASVFFNLNSACTNPEMQRIAMEISALLTGYSNDISLNEGLFKRIDAVYLQKDGLPLTGVQKRLLETVYKGFVRNGAALDEAGKRRYREMGLEISELSLKFEQNLLAATNAYMLHLTDPAQIEGLPDFVVSAGAAEARSRGVDGWVYTLHAPSYVPFLKFSSDRGLREQIWTAYNTRCFADGDCDNKPVVKRLVELRIEMANLLGYRTCSDYALEERMARTTASVQDFLDTLLTRSLPFARTEIEEVQQYAYANGAGYRLMPWDWAYWSEKLKDEKYALNDAMLKPYFSLENVRSGVFALAKKLYGLDILENTDIPVYHPDVKAYEVRDGDGVFKAVLYLDFFPRESKNGGAWMTTYRDQYILEGREYRPLVSIVCNFTKPTADIPSLLTFDEVTTFLHEFGHALHGIFAEGSYPSLTGTSVVRDFVELPSQIMENWALEKEFLALWARHYQTGETIPGELVDKIVRSKNYLSGYHCVRQVGFGLMDMAWHSLETMTDKNVGAFEKEVSERFRLMPDTGETNFSVSFAHIFSGGYTAGYYGYKWAEVLEADAFSEFRKNGIFDRETAERFRREILSQGNNAPAMELYKNFMGREPRPDALFEKLGMTGISGI